MNFEVGEMIVQGLRHVHVANISSVPKSIILEALKHDYNGSLYPQHSRAQSKTVTSEHQLGCHITSQ